ncbi:MAG: hypothetical protein HXY37_06555 [Chloroflexi bacterium]|nr:hypothetical protein [Chloroflexota bacterium]
MGAEHEAAANEPGGGGWPLVWRHVRQQSWHLIVVLGTVLLIALLVGTLAAWLQAGRDEVRNADVLLIIAPALPAPALLEHAVETYRRGYAPTVIVAGAGAEVLRTSMIERGAPGERIEALGAERRPVVELRGRMRSAHAAGAQSALIVAEPAELLLWLKLTHDQGLRAYGTPLPGRGPGVLELVSGSLGYWRYVLIQR